MVTATKTKTRRPGESARFAEVDISKITLHENDLRDEVNPGEVEALTHTLQTHGILQPILLRPRSGGRYECVAGGRRLRAALLAGWRSIPAQIRDMTDEEAAECMLVENISRRDLTPIEIAKGLKRLLEFHETEGKPLLHRELGERFKMSQPWITNHLALLNLPEVWQRRVSTGEITLTAARELFPLVKTPNMLAAIDKDYTAHPELYQGKRFAHAVQQVITAHPAVTQARRTWREPIADDVDDVSTDEAAAPATNHQPSACGHATTGISSGTTSLTAALGTSPQAIVPLLCSRMLALQTLEVDQLQRAIDQLQSTLGQLQSNLDLRRGEKARK